MLKYSLPKVNYFGLANEIKQNYTYDDLNRLKSATETVNSAISWKQTFNYDRFGNRTFDAANTTTFQGSSAKVANPLINSSDNRLKKDQDNDTINDYDYDKAGNVTLDAQNQRFIYDAENRLKQFFNSTNSGTNPDAVYLYDGDGKRVKKINYQEEVILVYNAGGTLIAEYSTLAATTAKVSYLTADHLGSPRIITDEAGKVVSRHDYTAFGGDVAETLGNIGGRTTAQGYGKADEIRKQYTGYESDEESGLEYAQARYYNSAHGRFTSVDLLTASANVKDPQTFNRYSYAMNSPYKFTDPLGLISSSTGACGNFCRIWDGGGDMPSPKEREEAPNQTAQQALEAETPHHSEAEQNADSQLSEESLTPPQIEVKSVQIVAKTPKRNLNGEVQKENGQVVFEEKVLAVGSRPQDFSGSDFEVNLNNAVSSLESGEQVFLKVELGIVEAGNQQRATLKIMIKQLFQREYLILFQKNPWTAK